MRHFHLFVPFVSAGDDFKLRQGCERIGHGHVHGTVYDLGGAGRVLLLYGDTPVAGEIWRCPVESLTPLDQKAGVAEGEHRRVARAVVQLGGGPPVPCWLYVAGPALSRSLLPDRRVADPR